MACQLLVSLHSSTDVHLSVLLMNEGRLASELRKAGLRVFVISEQDNSFISIIFKSFRYLSQYPPKVIHSHRYKENFLAFCLSILTRAQLVTTQHGLPETKSSFFLRTIKTQSNFFLLRYFFRFVVAVSRDINSFFVNDLKLDKHHVKTVHNGLHIPVNFTLNNSRFIIGSAGRLFPVKDYHLLLNIAKSIHDNVDINFVLAGEGPLKNSLETFITDCRLQNCFQLIGHKEDMDSFYSGLSVYINTSVHEGIPMTILEAMARGLPIIAPRVGGIPEVVDDGVQGFLIDGRDPQAFAEKIMLLYNDRELWQRMSLAAREKAERCFSVEKMAQGYLDIYRKLCGEKH